MIALLTALAALAAPTWTATITTDPMDGSRTCIARLEADGGRYLGFVRDSEATEPVSVIMGDWMLDRELRGGLVVSPMRFKVDDGKVQSVLAVPADRARSAAIPRLYDAVKAAQAGARLMVEVDTYRDGKVITTWTLPDPAVMVAHLSQCNP